jgi:DNA-binding transcriptional regulator YdaS (Cro superfamily)
MKELLDYLNSLPTKDQSDLCLKCGTTIGYIRKACSIGQRIGARICVKLEKETQGAIRCEVLRPDVDWQFLRDSK